MTTGLIGTSAIASALGSNAGGTMANGATLSYTCPRSGVLYSVISITASVHVGSVDRYSYARAGCLVLSASWNLRSAGAFASGKSVSKSYSIVLRPGQTWADDTEIYSSNQTYSIARGPGAFLQASVLEVV